MSEPKALFAVVVCSQCRTAWAVELRHATSTCPSCRKKVELAHRTLLWQGDSALAAQFAVAQAALATGPDPERAVAAVHALKQRPLPRHDSHVDAAAARAGGIINKSQRAEAVALWLTRLAGSPRHDDLLQALEKAGLEPARAETEITRMLAMDFLTEPKAGHYRAIEG